MLSNIQWPPHDPEIFAALQAAWDDGSWGRYDGPNSKRLVESLAELQQVDHVLLCSSGTIAVELALRGLGIGTDDEVLIAGYDFPGNFRSIEAVGAKPVLVDIDPKSWCLDVEQVRAAVGPQSKAIIVSHLHGGLANMLRLVEVAAQLGLTIVEDACQAAGAWVAGQPAGAWGDVGVLSFGGSKLLTAGRGGALVTRRADVYQRAKIFGDRGNDAFPLSELQAAVLVPQLAKLAERNQWRLKNVRRLLAMLDGVQCFEPVRISKSSDSDEPPNQPSFYKLAWRWNAAAAGGVSREAFIAAAKQANIPIEAGFRGFAGRSGNRCRRPVPLPHAEQAAESTLILHHPILLQPPETIDHLGVAIRQTVKTVAASSL